MVPVASQAALSSIFRGHEVKTLMALTGRSSWVLAAVASATLFSNPGAPLDHVRIVTLAICFGAWVLLHIAAFTVGIMFPVEFHYGAEHRLEAQRMQLGDSMSGAASQSGAKAGV